MIAPVSRRIWMIKSHYVCNVGFHIVVSVVVILLQEATVGSLRSVESYFVLLLYWC